MMQFLCDVLKKYIDLDVFDNVWKNTEHQYAINVLAYSTHSDYDTT